MNEVEARQEAIRILQPEDIEVTEVVLVSGAGTICARQMLPTVIKVKPGEEVELVLKLHFEG